MVYKENGNSAYTFLFTRSRTKLICRLYFKNNLDIEMVDINITNICMGHNIVTNITLFWFYHKFELI